MTRSTAAGNRFRTRKLSTKQSLAVLRESQIDSIDDDGQRYIPQIETGVDQREEIEHHLQAAISASQTAVVGGQVPQIYIPTPDASKRISEYEALYPKRFSQPTTYIRFSSTVEDCCGTAYCMDSEDDKFLQKLNSNKRSTGAQCSEDTFEEVMQYFENTVAAKLPYLHLETDIEEKITSFKDMEDAFDESHGPAVRKFAKDIYEHWKQRRIQRGGRTIMPTIRIESGADKDDDPYVCFRKFEHRQVRKTRRTDAQSTEKLKKLRQEMEMARAIVADVLTRERMRKESISLAQDIFELRATAKDFKRKNNIRGDDEDLYDSSKSRKTNLPPPAPPVRPGAPSIARVGSDMRPPEAELTQLSEAQRKKVDKWRGAVEAGQQKRMHSNIGVEDYTEAPISDMEPSTSFQDYRPVQTFFLPSPPASESPLESPREGHFDEPRHVPTIHSENIHNMGHKGLPAYRRRIGRGGRLFIDRKNILTISAERRDTLSDIVIDRFKYDNFEDDPFYEYPVDYNSTLALRYRARLLSPPTENHHMVQQYALRRQSEQMAAAQGLPPTPQSATRS